MAEDRDELLKHYRATRAELLAAIEGLGDEHMVERSLDGWSVKDHLAHLATWDEVRAAEVARISAGYESAWHMTDAQDDAYNELATALRWDLSLDQVRWELESTRTKLLEAIADATERGLEPAHYGEAALVSTHELDHAAWIRRWRGEKRI